MKNEQEDIAAGLTALADQIQQLVIDSGIPVGGFILMTEPGVVEYRTAWPVDVFRSRLIQSANGA